MKKITLLSLSAILFLSTVKAQQSDTTKVIETKETIVTQPVQNQKEEPPRLHNLELGVRFMPTFSSLAVRTSTNEVIQGTATMSNGYGFMMGINLTRMVGLQFEVNYLQTSQKYKDMNLDRVVNVNYLNIPVLLSLNTDKSRMVNWNVVIGPQFGINIGSNTTTNGSASTDTLRAVVAVKQSDVGVAYGTGLEFMLNKMRTIRIDAGFRGFYGLVNMNATNTNSAPNTYNVMVNASRKTYGGYLGLTFLF